MNEEYSLSEILDAIEEFFDSETEEDDANY